MAHFNPAVPSTEDMCASENQSPWEDDLLPGSLTGGTGMLDAQDLIPSADHQSHLADDDLGCSPDAPAGFTAPASPLIGTLGEGGVHRFLKSWYVPDSTCWEIPVGNYVADILEGNTITEIQTHNLGGLRVKLDHYLTLSYAVRVVFPVRQIRFAAYVDASGTVSAAKRIAGRPLLASFLEEVYPLAPYFSVAHAGQFLGKLTLDMVALSLEELRKKPSGKRCRGEKKLLDVQVQQVLETRHFSCAQDFLTLFDTPLPPSFTVADLANVLHLPYRQAGLYARLLCNLGLFSRQRQQRAYRYDRCETADPYTNIPG